MTEAWAAAQGIPLQIQYTIPVEQYGLDPNGEAVLQNAVADGAAVTSVNIMVFDYYIAGEGVVNMGQAAINAATNTHAQLASIYPSLTSAQIWAMEAMTMLPGIDDYPKKTEVTYLPDAQTMLSFARSNGMNFLSIWAIQRDNGGCPGARDRNTCSGIRRDDASAVTTWYGEEGWRSGCLPLGWPVPRGRRPGNRKRAPGKPPSRRHPS